MHLTDRRTAFSSLDRTACICSKNLKVSQYVKETPVLSDFQIFKCILCENLTNCEKTNHILTTNYFSMLTSLIFGKKQVA